MVQAKDIEYARRVWIDAMGTEREATAKAELMRLVELAKSERTRRQHV